MFRRTTTRSDSSRAGYRRTLAALMAMVGAATVMVLGAGQASAQTEFASPPAPRTVDQAAQARADNACKGWNGVATNFGNGVVGILQPPIMSKPQIGTPYVEDGVVKAKSSLRFYNWGTSCSSMVTFNLETKACGSWGCNWQTKDGSDAEFLWAHAGTGVIEHENSMPCRKGTHSYKVYMNYVGVVSSGGEKPWDTSTGKAAGTPVSFAIDSKTEEGDVIKLTC